jgi:hypothetical protein
VPSKVGRQNFLFFPPQCAGHANAGA